MKYIIAQDPRTGFFIPVIFAEEITHLTMACAVRYEHKQSKIFSAGFFRIEDSLVVTSGKSESLQVERKAEDAFILTLFVFENLSGLALSNMLLFRALQPE